MEHNYISEETMSIIKDKYNDYFKINFNSDMWLQRSIVVLEIYIPVLKYNLLNNKIMYTSKEKLYQLIESYTYLNKLNIISSSEFEKFEKFISYLPGFNFKEYQDYKRYNKSVTSLNTHIVAFENFGYLEMQIFDFLNNNSIVNDIILLEEKKRIRDILEHF